MLQRVLRFPFTVITKEVLQSLRSSYVPAPSLQKLTPYFKPCNVSSLYQLLSESKSFNNQQIEKTLLQINKLDTTDTSDEDKHSSARTKLDLSEIAIKTSDLNLAKQYLNQGLENLRSMEFRQDIQEAMFLRRLGEIELMNRDTHELAIQHLLLSIKLFEQYTQDQQIHMATAFGHLGPLNSLVAWYFLLHGNPQKAKEYTQVSMKYFLKGPYNHNDFEHMMCTRCTALVDLKQIEQMKVEASSVVRRTIDVSNKIWFLNLLVQHGYKEYTEDLQSTLDRVKSKLGPQKFEIYKKSLNVCI